MEGSQLFLPVLFLFLLLFLLPLFPILPCFCTKDPPCASSQINPPQSLPNPNPNPNPNPIGAYPPCFNPNPKAQNAAAELHLHRPSQSSGAKKHGKGNPEVEGCRRRRSRSRRSGAEEAAMEEKVAGEDEAEEEAEEEEEEEEQEQEECEKVRKKVVIRVSGDGGGSKKKAQRTKIRVSSGMGAATVAGLLLWLALLFYVLGTTASDYFTCTLERLSEVLGLSAPMAGVTLLAIGNGAPDVFSSIVAFISDSDSLPSSSSSSSDSDSDSDSDSIGFGSVLGGALFVTTVVSGTIAIATTKFRLEDRLTMARVRADNAARSSSSSAASSAPKADLDGGEDRPQLLDYYDSHIDRPCFIRDSVFLILSAATLGIILVDGKVQLWEASVFLCIYPVYIAAVWSMEVLRRRQPQAAIAIAASSSSLAQPFLIKDEESAASTTTTDASPSPSPSPSSPLQHPHFHVHSEEVEAEVEAEIEHLIPSQRLKLCIHLFYKYCIEWPCAIPRMLTIPVLEEDRWSRPLAIASCSLAPVFIAAVWAFRDGMPSTALEWAALGISLALGSILGLLAFFTTDNDKPPERFLWLWLAGSFFMCIVWFYLVANELVTTLETLGLAFSIDSTILGLTVLAWGNSIGDVVANITLALTGRNGVQIAIAGCYAGPLFNIVVGLGISLLVVSWRSSPDPFLVTGNDRSVFFMLGFFAAGLVWGLLVMSVRGVRLSRVHGVGLILLYCSFLIVALAYTIGWI